MREPYIITEDELDAQEMRQMIGADLAIYGQASLVIKRDPSFVPLAAESLEVQAQRVRDLSLAKAAFTDALDDLTSSIHHITSRAFELDGQPFTVIVSKAKVR